MTYRTVSEIRRANDRAGKFWFSPDTMRFFNSRVLEGVYGGRYFITSERYDWDAPRLYTVREASPDGSVNTVGEFQAYETAAQARRAARELAAQVSA